jgi:hypothetical protein
MNEQSKRALINWPGLVSTATARQANAELGWAERQTTNKNMDAECLKCGSYYAVRENCEPTPFCDECAHDEVERLSAMVDRLGNALREQNERWGLCGNERRQALKAFEELNCAVDGKPLPPLTGSGADMVNHPPHYTSHPSGVECIQVTEHYGFCIGSAIKYLWRAGLKGNAVEDLKKAGWYINREIAKREQPNAPHELPPTKKP